MVEKKVGHHLNLKKIKMAFKMKSGYKPVFKNIGSSPVKQTVTTDSKVVDKDKEMEISIRKMISKPNWNSGKKRSDYTAAELANVRNPKYQAMLSKIVQEEIDEKGDGSDKSGDNEGE